MGGKKGRKEGGGANSPRHQRTNQEKGSLQTPVRINQNYSFIRARQLEETYPGDPKTGVWPITSFRVHFGWGRVSVEDWPESVAQNNWPLIEKPGLDLIAKRNRSGYYSRARNLDECKRALVASNPPLTSILITEEWFDAENGVIPAPRLDDVIVGCHAVSFLGYDDSAREIKFLNSWGHGWGNNGFGTLSYEYYEQRFVESWLSFPLLGAGSRAVAEQVLKQRKLKPADISHPLVQWWSVPDVIRGGESFGFEVYDYTSDERMAWALANIRGGFLDIEELYVRPRYRRKGHGTTLCHLLRVHSNRLGLIPRLWVSFADCGEENRDALNALLSKLGLFLRNTNERWAAYVALPGRPSQGLKPIQIPDKPAMTRGIRQAATTVLASALAIGAGAETAIKASDSQAITNPEMTRSASLAFQHEEHLGFLRQVSTEGNPPPIAPLTAQMAEIAWQEILKASAYMMAVPSACTGPDGEIFYSWDSGRHHLELEIIPAKPAEFFYRDRETEQVWGDDYIIGEPLPPEAVKKLNLFLEPAISLSP
jgi:GNAT superfamily N-acetyltransferase